MPKNPQRNKGLLDIEKIQKLLPHRYPFLLVDRVLEMEKGKSLVAVKNVTSNEPFFQGHFPSMKVMPGVLIVEALAQAGGILLFHSVPEPQNRLAFLSKIEKAKFRKPVIPGDQLRLKVELIKLRDKYSHFKGEASVEGVTVTEGEVTATLLDYEKVNEQT
ncbi:3-hydroxyacyl-ACP dehydratase FabZ [bacterium]|nr:3-hydroxyacyl-ACP dehydratase FabZ [bacterium]